MLRGSLVKFSKQMESSTQDLEDTSENEESTEIDFEDLFYQSINYTNLSKSLFDDSYFIKHFFSYSIDLKNSVCLTVLTPPPNN